jgi:hypothetical protein
MMDLNTGTRDGVIKLKIKIDFDIVLDRSERDERFYALKSLQIDTVLTN